MLSVGMLGGPIQRGLYLERPARLEPNPQYLLFLGYSGLWHRERMLLGQFSVEIHFAACRHCRFKITAHLSVALLQVRNQFENAIFGVTGRLLLLVPVGDRPTQVHSLHLLHEGANHLEILVADRSHPNEVDQHDSNDILPRDPRMLLRKILVAHARHNKLILTRLAPIYVIVGVKEGAIIDHERHFESLVHDLKVAVPVHQPVLHFLVVLGQDLHLVLEVLDELLRHYVLHLHLTNVQRSAISLPHLMLHQVIFLVSQHDRYLSLSRQKLGRLVQQ